jgi:ParB family chromosome partitioning protein
MEMPRRRALGKGLEELFNAEVLDFDSLEEKIVNETPKEEIVNIRIDELRSNPYQPRKVFDEEALKELSDSIKQHGVFQPIIVKKSIHGYEIIAGERRVKASRMAGLDTVPAIIREFDDTEMMEIALLENLQREDLNPFEEANAYVKIMEAKNLTHDELAKVLGKSQSYITNTVGLLRLPENIRELVINGKLSMTHARILSKMSDINTINLLADRIIKENLSVRDLEEIAKGNNINKIVKVKRKVKESDREYKYAEELLCEKLDSKVRVYKNKIEVKFANADDLNRILEILNIGK